MPNGLVNPGLVYFWIAQFGKALAMEGGAVALHETFAADLPDGLSQVPDQVILQVDLHHEILQVFLASRPPDGGIDGIAREYFLEVGQPGVGSNQSAVFQAGPGILQFVFKVIVEKGKGV